MRDRDGKRLPPTKGWGAEIDGVPVVLLKAGRFCWSVYEPTCGKLVGGSALETREATLTYMAERVASIASQHGLGAGEYLRQLIAEQAPK